MQRMFKRTYIEEFSDFFYASFPGLKAKVMRLPQDVTPFDSAAEVIQAECAAFDGAKPVDKQIGMTPGEWYIADFRHWASSKHVYDLHPELIRALDVDLQDELSADALRNMPYPAVYVRCPKREVVKERSVPGIRVEMEMEQDGFFATMFGDVLHILFCSKVLSYTINGEKFRGNLPTVKSPVMVWGDAFDLSKVKWVSDLFKNEVEGTGGYQAVDKDDAQTVKLARFLNKRINQEFGKNGEVEDLRKAVAALLYITSKNADVRSVKTERNASKKKKGKAPRDRGETSASVEQVGYRIGEALGAARARFESENEKEKKSSLGFLRRKVASHVRRAHWHAYWTGPKSAPTGIVVHWIPPVFVNADGSENTVTTVHPDS